MSQKSVAQFSIKQVGVPAAQVAQPQEVQVVPQPALTPAERRAQSRLVNQQQATSGSQQQVVIQPAVQQTQVHQVHQVQTQQVQTQQVQIQQVQAQPIQAQPVQTQQAQVQQAQAQQLQAQQLQAQQAQAQRAQAQQLQAQQLQAQQAQAQRAQAQQIQAQQAQAQRAQAQRAQAQQPPKPPAVYHPSEQVHVGKKRGRLSTSVDRPAPSTPFYGLEMSLRAPKAGDAFFTEQRMEKRYDEEEVRGTPKRVAEWIARVLQGQVPAMNGHDWKTLSNFFKDGTIMCSLMNRLLRHAGMEPVGYRKKVNSAFVAMNNLEVFADACKRYGVPQSSLFLPSDVYEGRKSRMLVVVNTLNALGCVANARGFQPPYEEPEPPKADWCKEECYD